MPCLRSPSPSPRRHPGQCQCFETPPQNHLLGRVSSLIFQMENFNEPSALIFLSLLFEYPCISSAIFLGHVSKIYLSAFHFYGVVREGVVAKFVREFLRNSANFLQNLRKLSAKKKPSQRAQRLKKIFSLERMKKKIPHARNFHSCLKFSFSV